MNTFRQVVKAVNSRCRIFSADAGPGAGDLPPFAPLLILSTLGVSDDIRVVEDRGLQVYGVDGTEQSRFP
jgi:hypothetical protein